MDKAVLIAGFGCRAGVDAGAVLAALDAALAAHALSRDGLTALATVPRKRSEPGLGLAAAALRLPLLVPDAGALAGAPALTRSAASAAATGLGSAAEAAALAGAGAGAHLLGARIAVGAVTCALAVAGGAP